MKRRRQCLCAVCLAGLWSVTFAPSSLQTKHKLPRPAQMDAGIETIRDAKTGELSLRRSGQSQASDARARASKATLHVRVSLVEVACNVFAPDGTAVRGLPENDFRVFDDGVEQKIAHFDVSSEGASIALVIDASPSVLPDSRVMKAAAEELISGLAPADEVAVIDFAEHTFLLLPFSRDRALLAKAVAGIDVRALFSDTIGSNIYRSLYLAANEIFPGRTGRKAIVLLTDGQDSGLGLNLDGKGVAPRPGQPQNRATFQDVIRALSERGVEIYAISTQNRPHIMTPSWLAAHRGDTLISPATSALGIPAYTAFLAELVRRVGGELYFLNEAGTVAGAYRSVVQNLSAEYTLGYYPKAGRKPGWHSLRVEVDGNGAVRVVSRQAYYGPAEN